MTWYLIFLFLIGIVWFSSIQQNVEQERDTLKEFMNWIQDRGIEYFICSYLAIVAPVEIVEYAKMGRGVNEERYSLLGLRATEMIPKNATLMEIALDDVM